MADPETAVELLVHTIRQSAKYRHLAPDLIRRVGARELLHRRSLKEAIAATRGKLHQVAGAYWDGAAQYARWLEGLQRARASADPEAFRAACRDVMRYHASTRERLPILDRFYATILADVGPIRSVLDLACGLHPLAIPWMPLAANATYHAIDVYEDLAAFLAAFLELLPVQGRAEARDVLTLDSGSLPSATYDVAFLLKTFPCLEQIDRAAGRALLAAIPARHVIVSFPVQTLCGRRKGMEATYEEQFREVIAIGNWAVTRFSFASELVFRLSRDCRSG